MDPELRTEVNLPIVIVNRESLYVIIAVLGISILGCACVLTYSFINYHKLKRNAEEVRSYIPARAKEADQHGGKSPALGSSGADAQFASRKKEPRAEPLQQGKASDETSPVVPRRVAVENRVAQEW